MREHLILRLYGPLQAWGRESFEGLRPSALYPGRSALLGLLGACLGIDRMDQIRQGDLANSVAFAVRVDKQGQKMTDYYTIKNARKNYQPEYTKDGKIKSHETIQTWREYWQDAQYTVVVWNQRNAVISLGEIEKGIKKPVYTPALGRRSCPLTRPLFDGRKTAVSAIDALETTEPLGGTIYSDEESEGAIRLKKRDVPIVHQARQFASRTVYMSKGVKHVSE